MSLDIGDLVGYIRLDHSGVGQGITAAQREISQGMQRVATEAGRGGERAGREAGSRLNNAVEGQIKKLGSTIAGVFAFQKVMQGLNAIKDAASDLNETTSMSEVIFGKNAAAMKAWASSAPQTLGVAREEALRTSASFADMFQQIGFAGDAAMGMSKTVLQAAADLGSFKNLETGDVLERLAAAFRGEYDSLQALIPNISAARVETEAMAKTGKSSATALTAQEKAAATLAIVQKDGARAMGDFARTSSGAANSTKIATAQFKDFTAQLGQELLPAYIALVAYGRDKVIPFLQATTENLGTVSDAVAPVAAGIGDLVGVFRGLPGPIQASTVALLAMVALRGPFTALVTAIGVRLAAGAAVASGSMTSLRLQMMYAGDAAGAATTRLGALGAAMGYTARAGVAGAARGLLAVMGGPWGAAFIAATAVVTLWASEHQKAKQRVEELTSAIDADTGAVGKNTKEVVANSLEKSGAADAAGKLGISLKVLANAALGVPSAVKGVNDELDRLAELQKDPGLDVGAYGDLVGQRRAMETVRDAIAGTNSDVAEAVRQHERHAEMVGEDTAATGDAAAAQGDLQAATKPTTKSIEDQADAARDAAKAILELADAQLAASGAEISYQDALASGKERLAADDFTKSLNLSTKAGRENQSVLNDLAEAARGKAESDVAAGVSLTDLRKNMSSARADFIELAIKFGASKKQAEAMATQFGLTKKDVDTLAKSVKDLPASKQIAIEVKAAAARAAIATLREQLDGLKSKSVVVTVQGRFVSGDTLANGGRSTAGGKVAGGGADPVQLRYDSQGHVIRVAQANGGIHPARMYRPGDGVQYMFNEPETGGESFVPHALAKRPSALKVLGATADLFGLSLQPKSETRITKTSVLHTGPIYTDSAAAYADELRTAALLEH